MPRDVYGAFYETVSNPFLWFLQHQMYALPYGPNVDGVLIDAWRNGYRPANWALAEAVVEAAKGVKDERRIAEFMEKIRNADV